MVFLSILLQEGSLNKLASLSTIVTGAVSFDMKVKIFVMDSAVWAFRKDRYKDLSYIQSPVEGYGESLKKGIETRQVNCWYEILADLKEYGDVTITLCSLMADIDNLEKEDFIDIVDKILTIGAYIDDLYDADKMIFL
ncbi:MAG: hypothetical protein GPJ54_15630 [Candidatus Heimdallarchaeota archaeon]|nr:hypothetical protein [Candidatus Heimdallarchaeota archaeon]